MHKGTRRGFYTVVTPYGNVVLASQYLALGKLVNGLKVLVTASTRGIGFYAARELARLGARVAIASRSQENLEKAAHEILRATGQEPVSIRADMTRRDDIERLVDEAWRLLGGLDALVFNTGNVSCEPCYLHEAGYDDWVEAAQRHLIAPGYLASLFVRRLLGERRPGVIVFLSSVSVKHPMPVFVLADTARAGLVQLAKSIALRYSSDGIRAYTVLLGSFDTPGARSNIARIAERLGMSPEEAWRRLVIEVTPLRRVAKPEELGALLAYLLSPLSEYMNGSTLVLDGAMTGCV